MSRITLTVTFNVTFTVTLTVILFVTMLVSLIEYCDGPYHASLKIVTDPVTLYFLACGNDNNGNGRCNGIFSVTI